MIAVVNYGLGNLHSVQKAFTAMGGNARITDDPLAILEADKVVLPGVGAFADGMKGLKMRSLISPIKQAAAAGIPLLGICLGMQLLFENSQEQGSHMGLGLIPGEVKLFQNPKIKIPQIGWNQLEIRRPSPLLKGIDPGSFVYFNHSYYCVPDNPADILTTTTYGGQFVSAVQRKNIYGVQFHPEKSQGTGLLLIKNFLED